MKPGLTALVCRRHAALREVLLRSCFSPEAGAALAEQAAINAEA